MFTTLRYNEDTIQIVDRIPSNHAKVRSLACNACRTCKLKCSREEGGCRRCLVKKLPCTYPSAPKSRKPRARNPDEVHAPASTIIGTEPSTANGHSYDLPGGLMQDPGSSLLGPNRMIHRPIVSVNGSESSPDLTFLDDFPGYGDESNQSVVQNPFPSVDWLTLISMSPRASESLSFPTAPATPPLEPLSQELAPQNHSLQDIPSSSLPPPCACSISTMTLLEAITIEALAGSLHTVTNTLQTTKKAITQCKSLLLCPTHNADSNSLMLITIICQKLATIYQRTTTILGDQFNKIYHPKPGEVHGRGVMNAVQEKAAQVVVFGYEVDVEEEPCVFGGLLLLQLGSMVAFLMKLKLKLKEQGLESHLRILENVVADVEIQRQICSIPCEV